MALVVGGMAIAMFSACQRSNNKNSELEASPSIVQIDTEEIQPECLGNTADLHRADAKIHVRRGQMLALQTVGLTLTAIDAAVQHDAVYSVTSLATEELPPLPQGMINMTASTGGYRLLPGGEHFSPYAELRITYDPERLPQGYTPDDIYTSFYDTSSLAWVRLERVEVDTINHEIVSLTTHFTDFINELLKAPEMPETQAFVPTAMSDLEAVNPLDGLTIIQPPTANNNGTANLTYPLVIPTGRGGMQPDLALTYSSTGGSGWLGVGWDIPVPAITLDTRWGVPRYDTTYETEIYMLNGEQLLAKDTDGEILPMPHRTNEQIHRASLLDDSNRVQFLARTGDAHDSIVRYGDSPKNYWWKVIDRNGTSHYYGHYHDSIRNTPPPFSPFKDTNTIIVDSGSSMHYYIQAPLDTNVRFFQSLPTTLYDDDRNIARWMLTESRDLYGNTVRYYYDIANVRNRGAVGRQIYLDSISYTGYEENDGYYTVVFCRTGNNTPDIPVSCSNGFKEITDQLLNNVYLKCGDSIKTIWHFETDNGDSASNYKNRLTSVTKIDSVADGSMRRFLDTLCHCLQPDEDEYGTAPHIYKPRNNNQGDHDSLIVKYTYVLVTDSILNYVYDKDSNIIDSSYTYVRRFEQRPVNFHVTVLDTIHWNKLPIRDIGLKYAGATTDFSYYDAPDSWSLFGSDTIIDLSPNNANLHGFFLSNPLNNKPGFTELSRATALGLSTSTSWSVGGTAAVGIAPLVCLTSSSVGVNYKRSESSSESRMALVDLDGDGLPDKVYVMGDTVYFCRQILDGDQNYFADTIRLRNISHILEESSYSNTFGVQASLGGDGSASWTNSKSTISSYFADVNGDGLVDLVCDGQVYFNRLRDENGQKIPEFSQYSDIPVNQQGNEGGNGYTYMVSADSSCRDIIFDGAVDSNINCRRVWVLVDTFRTILDTSNDYSSLNDHSVDTLYKIFEEEGKTRVEVYHREWDCSYHDESPNTDAVWVWIAPENDTVEIISTIRLLEDITASRKAARHADGVALSVQHTSNITAHANYFESGSENTILMDTMLCDTCYSLVVNDTVRDTVSRGDMIFFRLRSREDRHFDNVDAHFKIRYLNEEIEYDSKRDFVLSSDLYFEAPVNGECEISYYLIDSTGDANVQVERNEFRYSPQNYSNGALPYNNISVSKGDSVRVILSSNNADIEWGKVVCRPHIIFRPDGNETIDTLGSPGSTNGIPFTEVVKGWLAPKVELNDEDTLYSRTLYRRLFGPLHNGWGQFAYRSEGPDADTIKIERLIPSDMMVPGNDNADDSNSMQTMTGENVDTTRFSRSESLEDFQKGRNNLYNPYSSQSAWVEMTPDAEHWAWVSYGHQNTIGRNTMSNSVHKEWFTTSEVYDPDNDELVTVSHQTTFYDDPVPPRHNNGTPAKAVRKVNGTSSHSWSVGYAQWGCSYSTGDNSIETDYMDLNGDRYPDIIGTDKVQYSQQWGGIGPLTDFPSILSHGNTSHTWTKSLSYSASAVTQERMACSIQQNGLFTMHCNGSGNDINVDGNIGRDSANGSWTDMNGDGLPDFVYPNGSVRLNIGYRFVDDKQWDFDDVRRGVSGALSFGVDLNNSAEHLEFPPDAVMNVYQGSIKAGFGINASYNQTTHMLMDINGDGLPDKLWRELNTLGNIIEDGENPILTKVRYNLGSGMFSEEHTLDIGRFHSSASFNESLDLGLTYGFTAWGFKITVGASSCPYSGSVSQDYVQLADINGDGLPDWVYSDNEDELTVRFNQSGKTNLLKSATNLTGASIELDYDLSPVSYNQPSRGWLMTRVTTDDPLNPNGGQTSITEYSYDNPYYDRYERMSYGYEYVVTKQIDPLTGNTLRYLEKAYDNRTLMRRGKLTRIRTYDGGHHLFVEKEMDCRMVDYNNHEMTGDERCPVIAYPWVEGTFTRYYEGGDPNTPLLVIREEMEYDRYHNVTCYTDHGDFDDPTDGVKVNFNYYSNRPNNLIGLREGYKVTRIGDTSTLREAYFEYNSHGRLTKQTLGSGPNAPVYEFEYDTTYGNLVKGTLPENLNHQRMSYSYTYDTTVHTYPVRTDNAYGEYSSAAYDYRFGKPLTVTDVSHSTMTYTYDFAGRLATVTSPMSSGSPTLENRYHPVNYYHGGCTPQGYSYTPSPTGHPYSVTLHYDDSGNLITRTAVLTDGFGRVLQTKKGLTANGTVAMQVSGRTFVDALGRAVRQHDPFTSTDTSLSHLGTLDTSQSTTLMATTAYDVLDRVDSTVQPLGITTLSHHDISNRRFVTTTTDPNGNITKQYYDYEGRQVQFTDTNGYNTLMHYDNLGQLIWTKDPEGFQTIYDYDNLGRLVRRIHPDAGTTTFSYDPAGNLMKETNPLGEIYYSYIYYRPLEKRYSYMTGNDVTYEYGTSGNDVGRPVLITDGSGSYECHYDALGNVTDEIRTIALPHNGDEVYRFHMGYTYDSWGRMHTMTYPDGEEITYSYQWGGDLLSMNGNNPYINEIRYNAFGQRDSIVYGNGTRAKYTYDALHRLKHLSSYTAGGIKMQDIDYTFDKASNIKIIHNDVLPIGSFAGSYQNGYKYDNLNRLVFSDGDNMLGQYDMEMQYSPSGRIAHKYYNTPSGALSRPVDMYYGYCDQYQPHAVKRIFDDESHQLFDLRWDEAGNLGQVSIAKPGEMFDAGRFLFWTEDNRMHTAVDDKHYSYYAYDYGGERRLKLVGDNCSMDVNAEYMNASSALNEPTLYPSAYMVLTNKGYTKHYYAGTERVAARLGGGGLNAQYHVIDNDEELQTKADMLFKQSLDHVNHRVLDENDLDCIMGSEFAKEEFGHWIDGIPCQMKADVECDHGLFKEMVHSMLDDRNHGVYFYHSDHLGSASWITDSIGIPIQHLQYLPYGEPYIDQRAAGTTYRERFRFTGKERDEETGYGYFGARYMDHELVTMWLSVDPMADKYPSISPYAYCAWNPVKLVDLDGREIWIKGSNGNKYQYKEGKLYNKDGSVYKGDDEFATRVQKDLNTLKEKGMENQISFLEKSLKTHCIESTNGHNSTTPERDDKASNGIGCSTTIEYNQHRQQEEGWRRPAVVGLAHEMQHAFDMDQGIYNAEEVSKVIISFCSPIEFNEKDKDLLDYHNKYGVYLKRTGVFVEKGEYNAVTMANLVYRNLCGENVKTRTKYNGISLLELKP